MNIILNVSYIYISFSLSFFTKCTVICMFYVSLFCAMYIYVFICIYVYLFIYLFIESRGLAT